MLTQYQRLRLLTAAGMEEPAEQGGSDGKEWKKRKGSAWQEGPGTQRGESGGRVGVAGSRKRKLRGG